MNEYFFAASFILTGVVLLLFFFILKNNKKSIPLDSMAMLQNKINALQESINNRFGETNIIVSNQLNQSNNLIQNITEKLTKLDVTNKLVVGFTEQLQNLQDILKIPKQRGVLGEYYLETVLKNVLPPGSFQMQYTFQDVSRVDAVIFAKEKIIPVDSKFSLENYEKMISTQDPTERKIHEKNFLSDVKSRIHETFLLIILYLWILSNIHFGRNMW